MGQSNFYFSNAAQPHTERSVEMLKKYPQITKLIGRNPWTFLILTGVVALQMTLAIAFGQLGSEYWWLMLLTAYCVGAFAAQAHYSIIHEATHNMIFKNRILNKFCILMADLSNTVPGAIGFSIFHLKHHAYMGDDTLDADLPTVWEARMVGNSPVRKAIWLALFPFFQIYRALKLTKINVWSGWMVLNLVLVFSVNATLVYFFGWMSVLYLFSSMMFALGFHPVGARWVQEHYTLDEAQETFSYYGPINKVTLNIGYHVEHHDFPSVPWNKLPVLRKIAPEYYNTLGYHPSWAKLMYQFITDGEYSLYRRVKR
ncbi:MAG: fatty acid desaturase [Bacteroidetes bacterium]|nr:fatty acid desaturase [Bacteroidota bacterium]